MPKKVKNILVIHGPNLNLLGTREKEIYGSASLTDINKSLKKVADTEKIKISFFQSNVEGDIVQKVQDSKKNFDGIVMNPAAYTHTSVAIRDAILATEIPTVEVHLSNVYQRESFRHHSYIAPAAIGQISGFGAYSYVLGVYALLSYLDERQGVKKGKGN